ncbi:hypothetical protein NOC27_1942 [Nitrosococcus oceani AFC27]|nr:hypothetical protein NOC27_1942 [Nitrosococcus oceani AFC27]
MKAQLKVGSGDQDFPSIPGLTAPNYPDSYQMEASWSVIGSSLGAGAIGLALAMIGLGRLSKKRRESSEQVQNFGPETKQRKRWRL